MREHNVGMVWASVDVGVWRWDWVVVGVGMDAGSGVCSCVFGLGRVVFVRVS